MRWTTPDFEEISLNSEVTAYVNTDDQVGNFALYVAAGEPVTVANDARQESSV